MPYICQVKNAKHYHEVTKVHFFLMSNSEPSSRDFNRRRDRRKQGLNSFTKAPPVILDRRERVMIKPEEKKSSTEFVEGKTAGDLVIPFLRRPGKFNTEGILKVVENIIYRAKSSF